MSVIKKRRDGKFIVAANYDGLHLAGPFDSKAKAFDAQDKLVSAVIRNVTDHGLVLVDEDNPSQVLGGPYKDAKQAQAERLKIIKGNASKAAKEPAPEPEDETPEPAADDKPEEPAEPTKPAAKAGGKTKAA